MMTRPPRARPGRPRSGDLADGERRTRMLRTARDLFQRRGFAAVTISDVAEAVGVTTAAVHYHFATKAELYAAVMRFVLDEIQRAIRGLAAAPEPVTTKLDQLASFAIVSLQSNADLDSMMRDADEHLAAAHRHEINEAYLGVVAALADLMREGAARGELAAADPELLAHAFWHLLAGFAGRAGAARGYQGRPEVAAAVMHLFLHGAGQESMSTGGKAQ
ncbi:MAG: TetR/AcrR family transcriptional regulator [Chloroflexota bacterium]|nr:TetR/AcrR family transcriptional regulator [Chloroflexota bacterium]